MNMHMFLSGTWQCLSKVEILCKSNLLESLKKKTVRYSTNNRVMQVQ